MPIQITPANPQDFEWCAELMASNEPWITLRRELQPCRDALARPGTELFIARDSELRAGFILMAAFGFAGSPYIASIATSPHERSRGVGAALLDFAQQHYAGRHHLFLLVSSFNFRAQEFYQRHGYQRVGEIPGYIVPGHSEIILHKSIS